MIAPVKRALAALKVLGERRPGLLVFLGALLVYLPGAGAYGLWDPWETHYGEVARQMTERGDFISLWWPGSPRETTVFQTKPVLSFWLMSLSMFLLGVGRAGGPPDEMAIGTAAEWAVRLPFCVLGALGVFAVFLVTAALAGRRAGFLAAGATATFPLYGLISRQAMTDMAFLAPMALALALTVLATREPDPGAAVDRRTLGRGRLRVSWPHLPVFYLAIGVFVVCTVPQLLVDSIELRVRLPWQGRLLTLYGVVAMIPYWVGLVVLLALATRFRDRAQALVLLAGTLAGLAVLGKGLAGLAMPGLIFVAFVLVSGTWRRWKDRRLWFALALALLAAALVAVPWHHAMYIRHGSAWWSELFGDNHWRRLMMGRHGDRGTFEYFLRELGYGTWPLSGFAAAAVAWALGSRTTEPGRAQAIALGTVWLVVAYAVVSASMTKFHHYILAALPGLGILVGVFLDELLRRPSSRPARLAALVGLPVLALVTFDLVRRPDAAERFLWLFSYDYIFRSTGRLWPAGLDFRWPLALLTTLAAVGLGLLLFRRTRRPGLGCLGAAAVATSLFLLHGFMPAVAPAWSQKAVIARYYQERAGPEERLIAYYLFWRGETFYTKNEIYSGPESERTVFDHWKDTDQRLQRFLATHRGRRHFFLFQASREAHVRQLLPAETRDSLRIIDRSNNEFVLAVASF